MARSRSETKKPKISAEFSARLSSMRPRQKVRAIVVLQKDDSRSNKGRRQSPEERRAAIERSKKATERAISAVDRVLARHGGKRLDQTSTAVRTVSVRTTATGIRALARSRYVKSVMEDQHLGLIR